MCFGGSESAEDIYQRKKAARGKFELPSLAQSGTDKAVRKGPQMKDVTMRKGIKQRSLLMGGYNATRQ